MFGFGAGKSAYPRIYSRTSTTKNSQQRGHEEEPESHREEASSTDSLEPAIDGPPSPEHIRAYTEQMKRSSIFGNNSSRTTLSSGASSFRSGESVLASNENLGLSRKSSGRSSASSMPSSKTQRPESVQIFGRTLFSRRGRRVQPDQNSALGEEISEERSSKDYDVPGSRSRKGTMTLSSSQELQTRQFISGPFNFQHVTHTGQSHLPNLKQASETEIASKFSAIRASQMPTNGELNGIQAQDLHFKNFSSVALDPTSEEHYGSRPRSSHQRQKAVLKKQLVASQSRPTMFSAKSHDNFRTPAPPRPPRSPLSPTCPVALPARTSSRTSSILLEKSNALATTSIERPRTQGGFRRPTPFSVPIPAPPPQDEHDSEHFQSSGMPHAVTTPTDEAWPLTASPNGNFGVELDDVQEEEEYYAKRQSRLSSASGELRLSRSVPTLRSLSSSHANGPESLISLQRPPLSPGFKLDDDSWDNAIDYAYEHEAEADCDYHWDQCSVEDDDTGTIAEEPPAPIEKPTLDLHLDDSRPSLYTGRFRPTLLVPSALDLPELSPMSLASTSSLDPRTPSNYLRPHHSRTSSHASSFKESHGFTLSPSLLIPSDFKSQMDHDAIYEQYNQSTSGSMFPQDHCMSPLEESVSSAASNRSSGFSRGSARSSSSTRISLANSRGSQDSTMLLSRAASLHAAHRSVGSASSLPDLVPSAANRPDKVRERHLSLTVVDALRLEENESDVAASPLVSSSSTLQNRRNKSVGTEQDLRVGSDQLAPPSKPFIENNYANLSPVAESFIESAVSTHGRKSSAPVASHSVKEVKGRARSASTTSGLGKKQRSSYMLFPQT